MEGDPDAAARASGRSSVMSDLPRTAAGSGSLVNAVVEQLGRYAPFDRMEREHLAFMAGRCSLGYYAKGEVILSPDRPPPDRFYVIKQGAVLGEQDVARLEDDAAFWELHPGECFPLGALLAKRPVASVYRAKEDTFCYELPREDFRRLMHASDPFHDFCSRRLASLLEQSKHIIQAQYARTTTEQQSMASPLGALLRRQPVSCGPQTPIGEVLRQMKERSIGSMVVTGEGEVPIGIFTLHDVLDRVALAGLDLATPVRDVMTEQLVRLPPQALACEAALAMIRNGIRHVLVTRESDGQLRGVVSERDLFSLQKIGLRQVSHEIRAAQDTAGLRQASHDIRQFAINMLAQGVGAEQLMEIISSFNDVLTTRVIELAAAEVGIAGSALDGHYCWLALGSEGRLEQTLASDQDNGLVFSAPPGWTVEQARTRLLPFAQRVNEVLDACGFPLCCGRIMASNADWCLSLEEWQDAFTAWLERPRAADLRRVAIFFDFRPLYGNFDLARPLRDWLRQNVREHREFLHCMVDESLSNRPPLGIVRDFVVSDDRQHPNTIDLKLNGVRPFVDAARVLGLHGGCSETGTIPRLRTVAPKWGLAEAEVEGWAEAFLFIQMLRLRDQYEKLQAQRAHDNRIDPDTLNELDRRILKEAFRQGRKLQSLLERGFPP